ncbi:hypothetical protein ABU614_14040 [Lysobacter firmicutimachus]|uniref:Lipoprotein n=1 Tax=Lysobacter firmicutimachus TaxID=1792846 RepID=A0AAU8MQY4_9GAMM
MKARFAALAFAVAALTACAHAGSGGDAPRQALPGQATALARGDSLVLPDGARLRFATVSADSRCPPKLQCVWAGDAVLAFEFTAADGARTALSFNTVSDPRRSAGAWTIEVQGLDFADPPNATLKIDAK